MMCVFFIINKGQFLFIYKICLSVIIKILKSYSSAFVFAMSI